MKIFLLKLSIYFILLLGICFLIQYFVDAGLQNYMGGNYGIWNNILQGKINADIIVQGSSRALVQIDPRIIENNTGLSCYNLGISGGRFIMQKAKWDSYIINNKIPKILIQIVDIMTLPKEDYIFNKVQYLPYLNEKAIASNLQKVDGKIYLEKFIPLYKYRGFRHSVFLGLKSYFNLVPEIKNNGYKGYTGVKKNWDQDFAKFKAKSNRLIYRQEKLKFGFDYLEELMKECKEKEIKLILVHAPVYIELLQIMPQKPMLDSAFSALSNKYGMQYWDFTADSVCYNKAYFYNSTHLNSKGAEIFSNVISENLKKYIQDNYILK